MNNPLLDIDSLPAFERITAADARPALEKVLAENRARIAELTSQPAPTFASLVIPVEELSYRLSRVEVGGQSDPRSRQRSLLSRG